VLFRKAFRQERIANGARERNIHCSAYMRVSEFGRRFRSGTPARRSDVDEPIRAAMPLLASSSCLIFVIVDPTPCSIISMSGQPGSMQGSTFSEWLYLANGLN
jgi:hypothetical protein